MELIGQLGEAGRDWERLWERLSFGSWISSSLVSVYTDFYEVFSKSTLFFHLKFIHSRFATFGLIKHSEATLNLQLMCGSVSRRWDQRRLPGSRGDKEATETATCSRGASERRRSLPVGLILMANLLSSVLCRMIRACCFCGKCKLLGLPGVRCHRRTTMAAQTARRVASQ